MKNGDDMGEAESYDQAEAQRRFERAVKAGLNTPPLPKKDHSSSNAGMKRKRKE